MTRKELSQLYHHNRELELDKRRLEELRAKVKSLVSSPLTKTPYDQANGSRAERYTKKGKIASLEAVIWEKEEQGIDELIRLEKFIMCIDDSLTRMIFTARFAKGLSWMQVADYIGLDMTDAYVRNVCYQCCPV
jgi:hypothetical protein